MLGRQGESGGETLATRLEYTLKKVWRAISISSFIVLSGFWCIKLVYCAYAFIMRGTLGVENVLTRGMLTQPPDPRNWGQIHWGQIAARYALLALVTVLLWLDNRKFLHSPKNKVTQV